ncbi:MAG: hypothetical protein K8L97_08730 [Anaerolineae bacterium]|nr:hypothetical protein [Anaerolineae bacterium]
MRVYRGCMLSLFIAVIAIFSIFFSRAFGILGLLVPPALVGFGYLLVDTIIVELFYWTKDRNGRY